MRLELRDWLGIAIDYLALNDNLGSLKRHAATLCRLGRDREADRIAGRVRAVKSAGLILQLAGLTSLGPRDDRAGRAEGEDGIPRHEMHYHIIE